MEPELSETIMASDLSPVEGAGSASGAVRSLLRIEAACVLAGAVILYAHLNFSWALFALLCLAPDLSMLGYLAGPRTGAFSYNLVHTYLLPALIAGAGYGLGNDPALALALIWIAHIAFDRLLGFGLKYPTRFGDTHLGRFGR